MPLYEYVCGACRERFERLVRAGADTREITCPTCGGRTVERVFSTFATAGRPADQAPSDCGPVG